MPSTSSSTSTTSIPCYKCSSTPTTGLNHEDTCKGATRGWILRYNTIRDALVSSASSSSSTTKTTLEPAITGTNIRPDFAITTPSYKYYYDVKIVAISADSAVLDPYSTLNLAAQEKKLKYKVLGPSFKPLVFSSGGLLAKESSTEYKKFQDLIGPSAASFLDSTISLVLLRTRARARNSIEN